MSLLSIISLHAQTNNKLHLLLKTIDNNHKNNIINLANSYYKCDSEKYNALIYLLENINNNLHYGYASFPDNSLKSRIHLADSLYFNLVKGKSIVELKTQPIQDSIKKIREYISSIPLEGINDNYKISNGSSPLDSWNAIKLQEHIDHMFSLRKHSPLIQKISKSDFLEYVFPYQGKFGRYIGASSKELHNILSKYINCDISDITEVVKTYHLTMDNFRIILGNYPLSYKLGYEEAFFKQVPEWDCYDVSGFGTAFLNAVGIPTKNEAVIAYKMLRGSHSHCAILKSVGDYSTFSLEGEDFYPVDGDSSQFSDQTMNIIEEGFAINLSSPYKLKNIDEEIPYILSDPRIKDVTSSRLKTISETFKIQIPTNNNVCYLASSNSLDGKSPVTWAAIDKKNNTATFDNIIINRLYFPVIVENGQYIDVHSPFIYIEDKSSSKKTKYKKIVFDNKNNSSKQDIYLTRKFPRKEKMIKVAKDLIGTTFIASNNYNFKDADTLYTLDFELAPHLQDIALNNSQPYQYYRIESPAHSRKVNISEVQYLTSKSFQYSNSIEATPLPILKKQDIDKIDKDIVRILEDSIQKINSWSEYDGKMTTAPSAYPNVTFRLKSPQVVTHVRVAPLNADNGIQVGDTYQLLEYTNGNWVPIHEEIADYNYIYNKNLKINTLYWLRNMTRGKEELAFYINDKKEQVFIYQ